MKLGFRSGLEKAIADQIRSLGYPVLFETAKIEFIQPAKARKYSPDFILHNGIIIETKGRFVTADRQKHIWVKKQHPELDIRFVFHRSKSTISKTSRTTYAAWCEKNGFLYADKLIPLSWFKEPMRPCAILTTS